MPATRTPRRPKKGDEAAQDKASPEQKKVQAVALKAYAFVESAKAAKLAIKKMSATFSASDLAEMEKTKAMILNTRDACNDLLAYFDPSSAPVLLLPPATQEDTVAAAG